METDTLEIRVHENIRVEDVVVKAIKIIYEFVKRVFAMFSEPEPENPEENDNDGRSPPDIEISVGEDIKTGEKIG